MTAVYVLTRWICMCGKGDTHHHHHHHHHVPDTQELADDQKELELQVYDNAVVTGLQHDDGNGKAEVHPSKMDTRTTATIASACTKQHCLRGRPVVCKTLMFRHGDVCPAVNCRKKQYRLQQQQMKEHKKQQQQRQQQQPEYHIGRENILSSFDKPVSVQEIDAAVTDMDDSNTSYSRAAFTTFHATAIGKNADAIADAETGTDTDADAAADDAYFSTTLVEFVKRLSLSSRNSMEEGVEEDTGDDKDNETPWGLTCDIDYTYIEERVTMSWTRSAVSLVTSVLRSATSALYLYRWQYDDESDESDGSDGNDCSDAASIGDGDNDDTKENKGVTGARGIPDVDGKGIVATRSEPATSIEFFEDDFVQFCTSQRYAPRKQDNSATNLTFPLMGMKTRLSMLSPSST